MLLQTHNIIYVSNINLHTVHDSINTHNIIYVSNINLHTVHDSINTHTIIYVSNTNLHTVHDSIDTHNIIYGSNTNLHTVHASIDTHNTIYVSNINLHTVHYIVNAHNITYVNGTLLCHKRFYHKKAHWCYIMKRLHIGQYVHSKIKMSYAVYDIASATARVCNNVASKHYIVYSHQCLSLKHLIKHIYVYCIIVFIY